MKNPLLYVRRKIFFKILIFAITAKSFLTHAFAIDFKRWVIEFEQQQNVFQGFANNDSWSWLSKNATSTQKNSRIKTDWVFQRALLSHLSFWGFFVSTSDFLLEKMMSWPKHEACWFEWRQKPTTTRHVKKKRFSTHLKFLCYTIKCIWHFFLIRNS